MFGELAYKMSAIVVTIFLFLASMYGLYAVYYAYVKEKNEVQKAIVWKSETQAFTIILCYFFLKIIVLSANVTELNQLWKLLHFGIQTSEFSLMTGILGICLFLNKRKPQLKEE